MLLSILDQCIDVEWWAKQQVAELLRLLSPGKLVTGAQRDPERYHALLKVLYNYDLHTPGVFKIETFEDEGFRVTVDLGAATNEVGRIRITGPDFDPAFAWPPWDQQA